MYSFFHVLKNGSKGEKGEIGPPGQAVSMVNTKHSSFSHSNTLLQANFGFWSKGKLQPNKLLRSCPGLSDIKVSQTHTSVPLARLLHIEISIMLGQISHHLLYSQHSFTPRKTLSSHWWKVLAWTFTVGWNWSNWKKERNVCRFEASGWGWKVLRNLLGGCKGE